MPKGRAGAFETWPGAGPHYTRATARFSRNASSPQTRPRRPRLGPPRPRRRWRSESAIRATGPGRGCFFNEGATAVWTGGPGSHPAGPELWRSQYIHRSVFLKGPRSHRNPGGRRRRSVRGSAGPVRIFQAAARRPPVPPARPGTTWLFRCPRGGPAGLRPPKRTSCPRPRPGPYNDLSLPWYPSRSPPGPPGPSASPRTGPSPVPTRLEPPSPAPPRRRARRPARNPPPRPG